MRADDERKRAVGKACLDLAFFLWLRGTDQKGALVAEYGKQGRKIVVMLAGKDFCRCHHCCLTTVFQRNVQRGGGTDGLSGADVAGEQSVHRRGARGHVVQKRIDCAHLCAGQRIGQAVVEALHIGGVHRPGGARLALCASDAQGQRKQQQLLKDQALACGIQRGLVFRSVDPFDGVRPSAQALLPQKRVRKRIGMLCIRRIEGVQRTGNGVREKLARKTGRGAVDGTNGRKRASVTGITGWERLVSRGVHGKPSSHTSLTAAKEAVRGANGKGIAQIRLIEIGDLYRSGFVKGGKACQHHAAADRRDLWLCTDGQNERNGLTASCKFGGLNDGCRFSAEFIGARIMCDQIGKRFNAKLGKQCAARFRNAGKRCHGG